MFPDVLHIGDYKTAANTFTERAFTPTHREMAESLNTDLYEQLVKGIAEGRHKTDAEVRELIDHGPYLPEDAMRAGLVDDLAYEDDEHCFWFAGRNKDIIVLSSGDNVSPGEIEGVLLTHPAVAACVVVGRTTPKGAQVPWAYVTPSRLTSAHALREFLLARLSDYKVPEVIELVSELPVGLSGKLERRRQA